MDQYLGRKSEKGPRCSRHNEVPIGCAVTPSVLHRVHNSMVRVGRDDLIIYYTLRPERSSFIYLFKK